jgi:hypothetical protein
VKDMSEEKKKNAPTVKINAMDVELRTKVKKQPTV